MEEVECFWQAYEASFCMPLDGWQKQSQVRDCYETKASERNPLVAKE